MHNTHSAHNRIKSELDKVTLELLAIIKKYNLDIISPLDIIKTARENITSEKDYVRFLELSLQGRLLGEASDHLSASEKKSN